jgi:hypothetical protein
VIQRPVGAEHVVRMLQVLLEKGESIAEATFATRSDVTRGERSGKRTTVSPLVLRVGVYASELFRGIRLDNPSPTHQNACAFIA